MAKVPTDIPGLWAWFEADAGVTGTTTVTAWADQSGNGNHLTAESTKEPALIASTVNSLPVISAYGKSARLFTSVSFPDMSAGGTVYMVARQKATGAVTSGDEGVFLGAGSPVNMQLRRGDTSGSGWSSIKGGFNTLDGNTPETTVHVNEDTFYTIRLRYDGTTNYLSINNGTEVSLASSGGGYISTPLTIFKTLSQPYGNKEIAAIVIYSGDQTSSNRALVDYYLNQRYATYTWSGGEPAGWTDSGAAVITFPTLPTKTLGDADFAPGATSTNTVTPITYSSSNTAVATIVSGNIHIVGAGNSNITASQVSGNGYGAATSVTKSLTVNSNTMADVANLLSGKVVSIKISTDSGTTKKTVVCSTGDIGVNGTQTAGAETATRCGVHKAPGTSGWEITGSGAGNKTLSGTEISVNEMANLFQENTAFKVYVQFDDDPTEYYREGTGYLSAYTETSAIDGFVGFDFTIAIQGELDLAA